MASQLDADIVSVVLLPLGKVAEAAPAQQSRSMSTSEIERSNRVWIADHLEVISEEIYRETVGEPTAKMEIRRASSCGFGVSIHVHTMRREGQEVVTYAHHVLCLDSSILAWPP